MLLQGKVCIVTGASKGLGLALATRFAKEGARIAICARNSAQLAAAQEAISTETDVFPFSMVTDVGLWNEARRFVLRAVDQFGTIDVLVNNASILGPRIPIADYPQSDFLDVLRVNLLGSYYMTKLVIPVMTERSSGSIINVSSGVGAVGKAEWGAYSISKFGVEALTQITANELQGTGVRVNTVNPGRMATEMRRSAYPDEDPSTLAQPKDVADVFVYLASNLSSGVTGQRFNAAEFTMPSTGVDTDEQLPGVV